MNNLYNFDLPVSMRLSGVTANTPEEYQNILNALYKGTYADPTYIQQQRDEVRQKYLATEAGQQYPDAPFALGGVGDPIYESEQFQNVKNYFQKALSNAGISKPENFQEQTFQDILNNYLSDTNTDVFKVQPEDVPKVRPEDVPRVQPEDVPKVQTEDLFTVQPGDVPRVRPEDVSKVQPEDVPKVRPEDVPKVRPEDIPKVQTEDLFTVQPGDAPKVRPEDVPKVRPEDVPKVRPEDVPGFDLQSIQSIDQDQAKEEASKDFLDDYISGNWPSGPGGKPEPPVIPSTDPQRWPMIPGGPSRPGPSGTGTTYPLAGTKDDTLIAATYPSDPKWMREIDKLYKEVKNKPYRPGDPKPGRGMGDIWPRAQLEQEKKVDTAIAAARKGSDEKRQLETFQSEFDPQKARTAVQAATNYRVGSGNSDPFRNTAFA